MSRLRVATVLAFVAVLAVLAGTAVAVSSYVGGDDDPATPPAAREPLTVTDPATGSTFEVPAESWRVEPADVRIYYADGQDRPVAVVRGPAVHRAGYCGRGSNRAFAGFTRQGFAAWVDALGTSGPVDRAQVELADGSQAEMSRVDVVVDGDGPCAARSVQVAMVEAETVRVVLVRDAGALPDDVVEQVLLSLELP